MNNRMKQFSIVQTFPAVDEPDPPITESQNTKLQVALEDARIARLNCAKYQAELSKLKVKYEEAQNIILQLQEKHFEKPYLDLPTKDSSIKPARYFIWNLTGGKCFYCDVPVLIYNFTIDHVVPASKGGKGRENKVPSCHRCNNKKGNRLPTETELQGAIFLHEKARKK